jgi:hypothetical protein
VRAEEEMLHAVPGVDVEMVLAKSVSVLTCRNSDMTPCHIHTLGSSTIQWSSPTPVIIFVKHPLDKALFVESRVQGMLPVHYPALFVGKTISDNACDASSAQILLDRWLCAEMCIIFIIRLCGEGKEGRSISVMHPLNNAFVTESVERRNALFVRPCYVAENNLG